MLEENEIFVIDFEGFDYNIFKELRVHSENYQETLLFKLPQAFSTISTINRDSIILLPKRIHGIDWDSGVYPYISIHDYLASLRIRFPNAIVFVDGHVKRAFISNYFQKVYILQQLGWTTKLLQNVNFLKIVGDKCSLHMSVYKNNCVGKTNS